MHRLAAALVVAVALAPAPLHAQSAGGVAAYTALVVSPPGALPPTAGNILLGRAPAPELGLRYGQWHDSPITTRNFGATGRIRMGAIADIGATLGYVDPNCAECSGNWMVDVVADQRYALASLGEGPNAPQLVYTLTENVGFAKSRASGHAVSASISGPAALVFHARHFDVAPFVAPGWGFGQLTNGSTDGGIRHMLGGGVAIARPDAGVALTFSVERIETEGARTVFGVSVNLLGRGARGSAPR